MVSAALSVSSLGSLMSTSILAYLDPGTGSMILQGILAALAMVAVVSRLYWQKLLVFLRIRQPSKDGTATEQVEGSSQQER